MTPDQISLYLTICEQHEPNYRYFFQFLFMTGTRLGEALAVTWDDIGWDDKIVSINKSYRRKLGSTKTGTEREVDLPDAMIETLKSLQTERKKEALRTGTQFPGIIFHKNGGHMSQNTARNVFKRTLKKTALPSHRIHDSRHSYASLMLKKRGKPGLR